ncbi:hypothetical protein THAOC_11186, partial [Thalassiosira oceanica]
MVAAPTSLLLTLLALFGPPFAHSFHGRRGALAFAPRGGSITAGSSDEAADDAELVDEPPSLTTTLGRGLVGVVDLRPEPSGDEIRTTSLGPDGGTGGPACDLIASLPTASLGGDEEADGDGDGASPSDTGVGIEDALDEQSANSHCIGRACPTVCILVEYDFEAGKTNLHRSFGGAKLMALVDGARSSGAVFLVGRLVEAFALGGEAFEVDEPFDVEFVKVSDVGESLTDNLRHACLGECPAFCGARRARQGFACFRNKGSIQVSRRRPR